MILIKLLAVCLVSISLNAERILREYKKELDQEAVIALLEAEPDYLLKITNSKTDGSVESNINYILPQLAAPDHKTLVLYEDQKFLGFVHYWISWLAIGKTKLSSTGHIDLIAVVADERHKGHGKYLLKRALKLIRKDKVNVVYARIAQDNSIAQEFFKKAKFVADRYEQDKFSCNVCFACANAK